MQYPSTAPPSLLRRFVSSWLHPFLVGAACALALTCLVGPARAGQPRILEIVHTNDLHGQVLPQRALWLGEDEAPEAGGLATLATMIEAARARAEAEGHGFLYLDAGDFWQGTPESDRNEGRLLVTWLNLVGLDAMALGDHDLDAGARAVPALLEPARFPVVSANLIELDSGRSPSWVRPSVDLEAGGVRVAVIGLLAEDTKALSAPSATEGLDLRSPFEEARREVRAARRRGAEVVVVLSHLGGDSDRALAAEVEGIDIILGGHSHRAMHEIDLTHGTLLHATWSKGSTLGHVEVRLGEDGQLAAKRAWLEDAIAARYPPHEATTALIQRMAGPVIEEVEEVLGQAPAPLLRDKGFRSSPLGSWTADLMRARGGTDVALHNKAGLRADIAKGPIRVRDVYQVSPFQNELVTLELTGRELRDEIEWALSDERFALEVSGLLVRYDLERPIGERVVRFEIGGEPVGAAATYTVTTNSFLGKGGHGHRWLAIDRAWKRLPVEVLAVQIEDIRRRGGLALEDEAEPRVAPAGTTMPAIR